MAHVDSELQQGLISSFLVTAQTDRRTDKHTDT